MPSADMNKNSKKFPRVETQKVLTPRISASFRGVTQQIKGVSGKEAFLRGFTV